VILWALCIMLGVMGFGLLLTTVLLLMWQMVEVGLLWVVLLIAGLFAVYVVVTLWDRYVKAPSAADDEDVSAAADL
jgi:phosphate/sulfate permease